MHPEILRELTAQRGHELRELAYRARLARTANRGRRVFRRSVRHLEDRLEADTAGGPVEQFA